MSPKRKQKNDDDSIRSTTTSVNEDLMSRKDATPPNKELGFGERAYQLVCENEKKIEELGKDMNNPDWAKKVLSSNLALNNIIKYILIVFFIMLIMAMIFFILVSVYQLNNLLNVMENIRDSENLTINKDILNQFNQLFFHAEKIIDLQLLVFGSIAVISILGFAFKKLLEKFIENLTIQKGDK